MEDFFTRIETLNECFKKYRDNKDKIIATTTELSDKQKEELDYIVLKLDTINAKINEINENMDELQYFVHATQSDKTEIINEKMEEIQRNNELNKRNNKLLNVFLPLMIGYENYFL